MLFAQLLIKFFLNDNGLFYLIKNIIHEYSMVFSFPKYKSGAVFITKIPGIIQLVNENFHWKYFHLYINYIKDCFIYFLIVKNIILNKNFFLNDFFSIFPENLDNFQWILFWIILSKE